MLAVRHSHLKATFRVGDKGPVVFTRINGYNVEKVPLYVTQNDLKQTLYLCTNATQQLIERKKERLG